MSCHLMWWSRHLMRCDCLCCVMSRDAMRSWWWAVLCCALQWDGMFWAWDAIGCEVALCASKWFCDAVVIQSTTLYYKVLLCTTKYYSSTTLYYKVLQCTTPVLLCTAKYYYSKLQSTAAVLLCTTLYYKVLLQFCYFIEVLLNWTLRVFKTSYIGSFLTKLRLIVDMIEFSNAIGWIRIIFRSFGHLAFGRACLLQKTFFN